MFRVRKATASVPVNAKADGNDEGFRAAYARFQNDGLNSSLSGDDPHKK